MTVKLKKQILRIGRFSVIALFLASFAILLAGAGKEERIRTIEEVAVEVAEEPGVWFVDEADVMRILGEMNVDTFQQATVAAVDLARIETALEAEPQVDVAEAWVGGGGALQVEVTQRLPLVRVMHTNGVSYYLDVKGNPMPLSATFTARVPLVSGHLGPIPDLTARSTELEGAEETSDQSAVRQEIVELTSYISQHPFWSAMIEQIHRTEEGKYQLVPKVGDHIALLGRMEGYRTKLDKLLIFYREGLGHEGWSSISEIDLQYDGLAVVKKTAN